MKRRKRRMVAILLVFAMIFTMVDPSIFGGAITVQAENTAKSGGEGGIYYISDQGDLESITTHCNAGEVDYLTGNYVMTADIELKSNAKDLINIGSGAHHFKGTFDGQGHKITGLSGDAQTAVNNGLFGVMEGATVKNLVIENADYRSNQYGGILAAQAKDCVIQNVTIIDSKCKVASLGAVVGLITTGGLYGGALVGYADNTKFYNCESRNTSVYVDTTGGVQALGGDGMYMGGLVGWMDNGSILEYSRVVGGTVSTEYYVAVGALAANNLYAGGLVGRIDGSDGTTTQVLDCFSSASVNYDGECYVSVGAGLSGYAGGIAARISGSNYTMERCHYAGNIHGSLLNSILVLPIIAMKDYYLGGIAGNVEDSSKIKYCYFNWDNAVKGNQYPGEPKMPAISGESNTGDVTTIGETQYTNPNFFVSFDFEGIVERTTENEIKDPHVNKWVIDPANKMPVHGSSVQAEIDFPGAGTISFDATSIQKEQTTDGWNKEEKPDDELANGTTITQIAQTHAEMNEELTLTATVEPGYNFKGWYLKGSESSDPISKEFVLTLGGTKENSHKYKDGDVFVAKYTANITFWKQLNETEDGYSNPDVVECTYKQVLDPNETSTSKEGCIFLGWTETDLTSETSIASGIDKKQLTSEKIDATGLIKDPISVTRPVTLYPVFIEFQNYNIKVQMQSAELESGSSYIKGKEGLEGDAIASVDTNGNLFISIDEKKDQDGKSVITIGNGYRFDGWYEVSENNPEGTLVSRSKTYYPPDVNAEHRYEARYEYKITAYIPARSRANHLSYNMESSRFGEFYVGYGVNINDNGVIVKPGFYSKEILFMYWTNDISGINMTNKNDFVWDEMYDEADKSIPEIYVKAPISIYAIVDWGTGASYHPVVAKTDFPAGTINAKITNASEEKLVEKGSITMELEIKEGYNLEDLRRYASEDNGESWNANTTVASDEQKILTDGKLSWTTYPGISTSRNTVIVARLTANINLFDENHLSDPHVIKRKYNSLLFNSVGSPTQNWDTMEEHLADPIYDEPQDVPVGDGDTPSDESMYKEGYKFFGWIKKNQQSEADLDLYKDLSNPFATTNVSAIDGYLLPNDFRVTEAMDICPVYAKYKFDLRTNFESSGVEGKPVISDYTITNDGELTITLPSVKGYTFQKWEINSENEEALEFVEKSDDIYTVIIEPEVSYTITAVYEATVSFKNAVKDSDGIVSDREENYLYNQPISDNMDELPISYASVNTGIDEINMQNNKFNENTYVFVGWKECSYGSSETEVKDPTLPYDGFVLKSDLVDGATNMIPVYIKPQVGLGSNIGEESKATISVSEEGIVTLEAPDQDGYVFTNWIEIVEEDGKEKTVIVSTTPNYVPSPEELREKHTYIACYDVIVTYKIPDVENGNVVEGKYTDITDAISYGQTLSSNYNMQAIIAAQNAFNQTTSKAFTGKWSTQESGDPVYEGTEAIKKPLELFPISTEAVIITYKIPKADENSQVVIDENGKSSNGYEDFPMNIPVGLALKDGYDEAAKLQMETRMSGNEYMFTGKWTDNIDTQDVYDRTAAITQNITLYPILKKTVTITYKIPKAGENGQVIIDENGKSSNGYDDFTTNIPVGFALKDGYDDDAKSRVETRMLESEYMFTGNWTKTEGSETGYDRTVAITSDITLYPILKQAVTITYKIPSANGDTGKVEINTNGTSDEYKDVQVRIPVGETISDTYDKEASIEVAESLEDTDWVFTGDWTETNGSGVVYEKVGNENKELFPILKLGKYIPIYSNMSDTSYNVGMVTGEDGIILPKETVLLTTTAFSTRGATGIDGRVIFAQFVGYSLVTIGDNGNRTSEKLYKAGDTLPEAELAIYSDNAHRIYAVWTQIQNIPGASIYQNGAGPKNGLLTAAAVNTKILANAGLQDSEAKYDRHILYSKDSKYLIVNTDRVTWNNTLYKKYFDKDFVKDETWNIYASCLYNISTPVDKYGVCPYLSFTYKNGGVGNFRDETNQTDFYTLKDVAEKLLDLNLEVQEKYSWYNYKTTIQDYADYGENN